MTLDIIAITDLCLISGGQQAETPSPSASATRRSSRDEEEEDRFRETEDFRAWEKSHRFQSMWCQGDRACAEMGGWKGRR
jgi:hypothetical protein